MYSFPLKNAIGFAPFVGFGLAISRDNPEYAVTTIKESEANINRPQYKGGCAGIQPTVII
jgi:hypothetical protein